MGAGDLPAEELHKALTTVASTLWQSMPSAECDVGLPCAASQTGALAADAHEEVIGSIARGSTIINAVCTIKVRTGNECHNFAFV